LKKRIRELGMENEILKKAHWSSGAEANQIQIYRSAEKSLSDQPVMPGDEN
jgi:hypothetical protein